MSTAAVDKLRPRAADPLPASALIAIGAHALLVIALALGVSWRVTQPDGGEAELWSAVPQPAPAPLPPAPPPEQVQPKPQPVAEPKPEPEPEREAEIAEQPKPKPKDKPKPKPEPKPEPKREEPPKKVAKAEPKPAPAKADPAPLKSTRNQQLNRMFSELGVEGGPGTARSSHAAAGNSDAYIGRVRARIKPNIVYTDTVSSSKETVIRIRCDAAGRIVGQQLVSSSGLPLWDEAVQRAITRTEVLPLNEQGRCPAMELVFRPQDF